MDSLGSPSYHRDDSSESVSPSSRRNSSPLPAYLSISPSPTYTSLLAPRPISPPPAPAITSHSRRKGHVVGSLGGDAEDWDSVDTVCRTIAEDQVFKSLMREPGTASVCVGSALMTVRTHGELKVFQGFERWVCTFEHGHRDRDDAGRNRHWEGTRRYTYTAIVETCIV